MLFLRKNTAFAITNCSANFAKNDYQPFFIRKILPRSSTLLHYLRQNKSRTRKTSYFYFGAGERGHTLHASTGIKTHHFTRFSGDFWAFLRDFLCFNRPLIALLFRTRFRLGLRLKRYEENFQSLYYFLIRTSKKQGDCQDSNLHPNY